ncbi:WD domain, G-beta repeat family protein [Theileria equi strain WA]|uniref:WD domain, G-beta repeat family protein n=1 Tax=Theileria equi strain WA TaxID=1537102 RepID=L0AWT3_THEEQ|nr:WD domain, G-beta repeat family protein [Theileria equi strain WA]AFZ80052.1 WD domain, G-beta repeat family protein [Theileria equi strain WA]|eukprot:XP_004829718.1 WD domain, G-beta repeat family protein [Theileria equi strain WA]
MLENKIIEILNSVFEPYIDGLNPTKLSLANLLSGKLVLNNLHVKTSVVDFLELPFHLTFGLLGTVNIKVQIPILSLSKKNLSLEITDMIFLLTTKPESQWDSEAYRDEYIASKIAILAAESLQLVVKEIEGSGFVWNTVLSFLETLEINIHNVHIRLEDYTTNPNVSYAIGCVIKRAFFHTNLRQNSGDDGFRTVSNILLPFQSLLKSENGKQSPSITHRTIDLEGFGFYVDQLDPLGPVFMKYKDTSGPQIYEGFQKGEDSLKRNVSEEFTNDELAFLDAIGSHQPGSDQYRGGVSYQSICVVKTETPRKRVFMRKPNYRRSFLSKNRRLKFNRYARPRYKTDVQRYIDRFPHADDNRQNVIDKSNLFYTLSFSHILGYLVRGSHVNNCDNHVSSFNVWERGNYKSLYKSSVYTQSYTREQRDPYATLLLNKKRRSYTRDMAKQVRTKESASFNISSGRNSEDQSLTSKWRFPSFLSFKRRKSTTVDSAFGKYSANVNANASSKELFGYKFSPGRSWRTLLSTFCTIQKPNVSQNNSSLDIINRSQTRDRERRSVTMSMNAECCDAKQSNIADSNWNCYNNDMTHSNQTSIINAESTLIHTELAHPGNVRYSSNDYLFSYDVNWHVRNKGQGNEKEKTDDCDETASVKPESVNPEAKLEDLRMKESWTRLTFVTHDESSELLEFFLKTLDETDHNYFLNPKDFKGVASFYFCSYPILPSQILKSCWSAWGSKYGRARSTSLQNDYLPRCSVFLVFEDIDITISKEQVDCIYNVFCENLYKYWYWSYGVISTFENPRATPEDEKMYMEYWPQYLLLENNAEKDELKDFVLDFEILHSIQTIRVLRNRASVSLSELIRNFGRGLTFCSMGADFNSCVADTLFTNICSSYEDRDIDVNGVNIDNTSKVQDRLKFVGGIYELASKHANSTGILTSLRKICNQQVFTVDIVLDIFLLNSRLILTNKMESFKNISNIMGYILSVNGFHLFYQDTIGRDGSQFIEVEALPFSILSLDFCASPSSELFSTMGCACKLLSGPPSILVACGNVPQLNQAKVERSAKKDLLQMLKRETKVTVVNNSLFFSGGEADAIISITDSVLYFSIESSHFCTPNISDVRVRFHLNSELFIHFPVLDEINNVFRVHKYNMQKHLTLDAVKVYADKKREYHLNDCRFDNLREVYELIDLGSEYMKDIVQGSIPFLNYDFLMESTYQTLVLVDLNLKDTTFSYFFSIDSFSVRSEIAPRVNSANHYDLHHVRINNPRILSCNDFSSALFSSSSSSNKKSTEKDVRFIYMGPNLSIPFSNYISTLSKRVVSDSYYNIDIINKEFEILKFGEENDLAIKIKSIRSDKILENSIYVQKDDEPSLIIELSLGSVYINLRDIDIAAFICTYGNYMECYDGYMQCMTIFNKQIRLFNKRDEFNEVTPFSDQNSLLRGICNEQGQSLDEFVTQDVVLRNTHGSQNNNLRALVSVKWAKLQSKILQNSSSTSRYTKYDFDMDYLCLNFHRVVDFSSPKKSGRKSGARIFSGDSLADSGTIRDSPHIAAMSGSSSDDTRLGQRLRGDSIEKHSYQVISNDLVLLESLLKFHGITTPLFSLKVTGVGLKTGVHNGIIKRLCGFLGCIEVEDQSNSVPLYSSTIFRGGYTTLFWRWLKVKREINIAKKFQGSLFSAKNKQNSASKECKMNHVDAKTGNVQQNPNCKIIQSYKFTEDYLKAVMDYNSPISQSYTSSSLQLEKSPCFVTISTTCTPEKEQNCLVYVSGSILNIAWEAIDEILHFFKRIVEYTSYMPNYATEPVTRQTFYTCGIKTLSFTMHLAKSKINILSESSWFGYPNLVKYMWYKVLRDHSGIVDPPQDSRRSSIVDPIDQTKNIFTKFAMGNMDFPVGSGRAKVIRERSGSLRSITISTDPGVNMGSSVRWSLVRLIVSDRNKRAYISFPISLSIFGEGSIYLHYTHSDLPQSFQLASQYSKLKRDEGDRKIPMGWWSKYMPCIIQFKAEGRNISSLLSRQGSGEILTPCGYHFHRNIFDIFPGKEYISTAFSDEERSRTDMHRTPQSGRQKNDGYRNSRVDFNRYMRLHNLQDSKLCGLLEISKHTLYDIYDSKVSEILKPFRCTFSTVTYLYDSNSQIWYSLVPQSVSASIDIEAVDIAMNCVDLLSLIDTLTIASKCVEGWNSEVLPIHVPQENLYKHDELYLTLDEVLPVKRDFMESEEFHSCSSYESDADWTSIMSNEDTNTPVEVIGQDFSVLEKKPKKRDGLEFFLLKLLSNFSLGLSLNLELVNIEISSNIDADIRHIFVLSLEDTRAKFWVNSINNITDEYASTNGSGDVEDTWIDESLDFYILDLCLSGIDGLLVPFSNLPSNYFAYRNCSKDDFYSDEGASSENPSRDVATNMLQAHDQPSRQEQYFVDQENLMQFECQTLITFDISKDSSKEMTLETVKVLFTGHKTSPFSKTTSNINVSWININITLNAAECYFGFLSYLVAMSRLHSIILDGSNADYVNLQPAALCNIHDDVKTTMAPFNLISEKFKHNFTHSEHFGIFTGEDVSKYFEFRYFNNLFAKRGSLDIHEVLLDINKTLLECKAINMGSVDTLDLFNIKPMITESSIEPNSYLYNNLGQPILICTGVNVSDNQLKWKTVLNGESCILSSGHYGVISPFIIRLQIGSCVYDIPSSSLEIAQNVETMFKLEITRGSFKRKFMARTNDSKGHGFKVRSRKKNTTVSFVDDTKRRKKGSIHGKSEGNKFAYIMVRTVERFGIQTVATSIRSAVSIHLSSAVFVSNKSRENVVVFPSLYPDAKKRTISYSSLLSLNLPIPPVFLPVSSKNLVTLRGRVTKEGVGNVLLRQIANIAEYKAVRKLAPVHVLDPFNRQHENKLQYIVINGNFFHPNKIPVPLSWTIDNSLTICISLEEDFPFYAQNFDLPSATRGSFFTKLSSARIDGLPSRQNEVLRNFGAELYKDMDFHRGKEIYFNGDILLSSESAQHLYDSIDSQRLKTPIPGYTAQVNLGRYVSDELRIDSGEFVDVEEDYFDVGKSEYSSAYAKSQTSKFSNFPSSRKLTNSAQDYSVSDSHKDGIHRAMSSESSFYTKSIFSKSSLFLSKYLSGGKNKKAETERVTARVAKPEHFGQPAVTLSSTLIELSSTPKQNISLNPLKYVIRQYEILLESCQVIENLMPHDVHFITPAVFDLFKGGARKIDDAHSDTEHVVNASDDERNETNHFGRDASETIIDSQALMIKAGGNAHLARGVHKGRFILNDLMSREIEFRVNKDTCTNLVFEVMQPGFLSSAAHYICENNKYVDGARKLPRRIIVSLDISKKSTQPVKDKNGYYRRYVESSQISCTIFVDKWVINWLDYPVVICRSDGRFQQTIGAKNCTVASQDLTSTQLQLAVRKSNLKLIPNFDNYPKNEKRWFSRYTTNHVMSTKFLVPDLTFATCSIKNVEKYPNLHYLVSTCMAPLPFYRTSIIEILPQMTLINEFDTPLWIRETTSGKSNMIKIRKEQVWYRIDSGTTVEFHTQTKGEPLVKITGADPGDNSYAQTEKSNWWSCAIALKPSTLVQFRFPVFSGYGDCKLELGSESRHMYGICEVEIQMHRGAKLVRFSRPTTPEWVILNSTGMGLWVEQYGTSHGEVIPFGKFPLEQTKGEEDGFGGILSSLHPLIQASAQGRYSSAPVNIPSRQYFATNGVPFAWYDPFKDQKLVCRFHTVQKLAMFDFLPAGRLKRYTNIRRSRGTKENDKVSGLFALGRLTSYGQRKKKMDVKVKGYLLIDLSKVESVSYSTVCQIRFGKVKFNVRVQAQSLVMFGQKTLYLTASKMNQKTFSFKYLKATNILQLYKQLRKPDVLENKQVPTAEPLRRARSPLNPEYVLHVTVSGLGVCLCSYLPDELVYLSFTSIKFRTSLEDMENKNKLSIGWMQSDVHDSTTCFPTMIRPIINYSIFNTRAEKPRRIGKWPFSDMHNGRMYTSRHVHSSNYARVSAASEIQTNQSMSKVHPILVLVFNTRSNVNLKEVTEFTLDLEPISINLDTRIVSTILLLLDDYISIFGFSDRTSEYFATPKIGIFSNSEGKLDNFDTTEYPLSEIANCRYSEVGSSGTKYNISQLKIGKLVVVINIRRSGTLMISDLPPQSPVIRYLVYIVRRTPHISDAHITLAKESLLKLCCTPYVLISHFATRYISQAVQQIYKVLWAVDLIGNPKMVANHWFSGLYISLCDVREALRYVHLPPVAFFLILKGISHFGIALFSGVVDAFYRFTGSWYLLLNTMACNSDRYAVLLMQEVFTRTHGQPSNIVEGFLFGWISVGRNIYISWGNFALKPIHAVGKFVRSLKEERGTKDALSSGVHILGSLVSAASSLVFGTASSILSGMSLALHGLLNQIHAVPMLSAIRPKRSSHSIKMQSPTRYNFLESWSMESSKKMEHVNEVLLILPLDIKRNLFDPTYISTSHWSILDDDISPLILSQSFDKFKNMLWIDCSRMGYIENEKIRWKVNNRDVVAVEVLRIACDVPSQNYPHLDDDKGEPASQMTVKVTPKVAKKYFSKAQYYIRIIHIGAESNPLSLKERKRIPRSVQAKLMDRDTFDVVKSEDENRRDGMQMRETREIVVAKNEAIEVKEIVLIKKSKSEIVKDKVAEIVRMPGPETAMLYFTLLVSILREAVL